MNIEAYTLYSGSSGNSVLVRAGSDAILIDCGKTAAALTRAVTSVGGSMNDVRAVFITHEHRDHVSALEVASKKYALPVHITADSLAEICGGHIRVCATPHPPVYTVKVGAMEVTSFRTHHDSVMSVGYTVGFDGSDIRLGLVTDTGHVSDDMIAALSGCTHVILESNHDVGMLTHGSYPFFLKERILSDRGHLSNDDAAELAGILQTRGAHTFMLAHISRENNTPDTALQTVEKALTESGMPYCLYAAAPDVPGKVI